MACNYCKKPAPISLILAGFNSPRKSCSPRKGYSMSKVYEMLLKGKLLQSFIDFAMVATGDTCSSEFSKMRF